MLIKDRIRVLRGSIDEIKYKNGITREIKLIAVSKNSTVEAIMEAYISGERAFGENKIQEAKGKIAKLASNNDIEWHFIGNLQRNKIKKAVNLFSVIHSIDSVNKAFAIDNECSKEEKVMDIFIQVNTTNEKQKSGVYPSDLPFLLEEISVLSNVRVIGLMTISILTEDRVLIQKSFASLRELSNLMNSKFKGSNIVLDYLSMGMSGDYDLAIKEGSTHLRIGSFIFA